MAPLAKKFAEITVPVTGLMTTGVPLVFGEVVPIVSYEHMLCADATVGIKSDRNTQIRMLQLIGGRFFSLSGWWLLFFCPGKLKQSMSSPLVHLLNAVITSEQ